MLAALPGQLRLVGPPTWVWGSATDGTSLLEGVKDLLLDLLKNGDESTGQLLSLVGIQPFRHHGLPESTPMVQTAREIPTLSRLKAAAMSAASLAGAMAFT